MAKISADIVWPAPTRVYESHHFDSGAWDVVKPRADDIVIATAYKAGTTWMQNIVASLIFQGSEPPAPVGELSPWVDLRLPPREVKAGMIEGQTTRRFLKTHLPTTALTYSPESKYIYVARDGRDAFMSLLNHYKQGNDTWYGAINGSPGLVGPELPTWDEVVSDKGDQGVRDLFDKWLSQGWATHPWEEDGWPFWSLFYNFESWWKVRSLPNVLFVHFNDLKKDLPGQMSRIADFLDIEIDEATLAQAAENCTFDSMKKAPEKAAPLGGAMWKGGANDFIFKGTNGRWKGVLTEEQVKAYEEAAQKKAGGAAAAKWLSEGGPVTTQDGASASSPEP